MNGWLEIGKTRQGERVFIKFHTCSHQRPDHSGCLVRFGGELEDDGYGRADEGICVGGISWCSECHGETWTLHKLDPLHVEPSIACRTHPAEHHGWIRNGLWEPA